MILTITWTNPTPHPGCGYRALYRRKGDATYTTITTSGSTSGTTSIVVQPSAPASYEGYVQSNCCSDSISSGDPFGTNAYSTMSASTSVRLSPPNFLITITSLYANPYATIVSGTFTSNQQGVLAYSVTYPAGVKSAILVTSNTPTGSNLETTTNTVITTISPIFNNGGSLQQFDPISTPAYFKFTATSGQTSGTTYWNGAPTVLPSFTLDTFSTTETDLNGNVLAGNLNLSWIQSVIFAGGVSPYDLLTLKVYEGATLMGELTVPTDIKGLRSCTIPITKGASYITSAVQYKLESHWSDGTLIVTAATFYLPLF